ncbi:UNVERIFIED_CONTAM: hypothetical protein Sindi_1060400 [Sesamum indicum]
MMPKKSTCKHHLLPADNENQALESNSVMVLRLIGAMHSPQPVNIVLTIIMLEEFGGEFVFEGCQFSPHMSSAGMQHVGLPAHMVSAAIVRKMKLNSKNNQTGRTTQRLRQHLKRASKIILYLEMRNWENVGDNTEAF